jgi:hypothetical protein
MLGIFRIPNQLINGLAGEELAGQGSSPDTVAWNPIGLFGADRSMTKCKMYGELDGCGSGPA